ncbi:MAG: hypothetical protein ACLRFH_03390 [Opitutales bacterium]
MCLIPENLLQEQIMIQTIDTKENLIQQIKNQCEVSMELSFKEQHERVGNYGCDLIGRAIFLDLCNTKNYKEIFKFQLMELSLDGCKDCLVPRAIDDVDFMQYHIKDEMIYKLQDLIKEPGIGEDGIYIKKCESVAECPRIMKAIYQLLAIDPSFPEPEFTNFDRVPKDIPIRLADGKPNPEFFKTWFENTKKFFEREGL